MPSFPAHKKLITMAARASSAARSRDATVAARFTAPRCFHAAVPDHIRGRQRIVKPGKFRSVAASSPSLKKLLQLPVLSNIQS
jgi:hypothetical protein